MRLTYIDRCITTDQIKIKRGIFQGDSFPPLQFYLALAACAFNGRAGYIWVWLQDQKRKCSDQKSLLYK